MELHLSTLLPYLLVIGLISLIDFVTLFRSRLIKPTYVNPKKHWNEDFSLLIPIFGDLKYLKNVEYLKDYGSKVVLCTTTKETPEFNAALDVISKKYGFKVFRSEVQLATAKHKPNPWKIYTNTLNPNEAKINKEIARDEIIKDSFDVVTTKYCIFMDGDTITTDRLERLAGIIDDNGWDLASVRVLASKKDTLIQKLQSIEYDLAMDARRIYPWLTSGAGMISKTEVIRDIMKHHSLFFSGGDIEIGKLAKLSGYKVHHVHFVFLTDVPETFKGWVKQRMAWCGGGFRHAVVNMHKFTWTQPLHYFYVTFLVYLMTPIRWYEVVKHPQVLLLVICLYWVLIFAFHFKHIQWYYALFPLYAMFQILFIVPMGVYTYLKMAVRSDNVGFIKLRFDESGHPDW